MSQQPTGLSNRGPSVPDRTSNYVRTGSNRPGLDLLNIKSNKNGFLIKIYFLLQFTHLPAHSWHKMPLMKSLDISWNPIRVLTKESFYGLVRLQLLRVQHLPDLKRFDGDSLAHISYLTKLYIQSWPSIEKYKV